MIARINAAKSVGDASFTPGYAATFAAVINASSRYRRGVLLTLLFPARHGSLRADGGLASRRETPRFFGNNKKPTVINNKKPKVIKRGSDGRRHRPAPC